MTCEDENEDDDEDDPLLTPRNREPYTTSAAPLTIGASSFG